MVQERQFTLLIVGAAAQRKQLAELLQGHFVLIERDDGLSGAAALVKAARVCSTDAIGERMLPERLLVFSSSIRSFSPYLHLPDKLPYKAWNSPAMYGENESEPFILF